MDSVDELGIVDKINGSKGESRRLEFKQSTSWQDPSFRLKITKSILAMSNVKFGGEIIIGVKQITKNKFEPEGMTEPDYNSYNHDDVSSFVAEYADPYVQFTLQRIEEQGKKFVIFNVNPFDLEPVICKKDGWHDNKPLLHKGLMYVRSRRMIESSPVSTVSELREILDMATEYGVSRVLRIAQSNNLITSSEMMDAKNKESFDLQHNEFRNNNKDGLDRIITNGYWSVIVYPHQFQRDRLNIEDCQSVLHDSVVNFREYSYPPLDSECCNTIVGNDYVQWVCPLTPVQLFEGEPKSIGRLFTSGGFINYFSQMEDFWENSKKNSLNINTTIYTITEIFYFLSQLANRNIFEVNINLELAIHNIKGKRLSQTSSDDRLTDFKSNIKDVVYFKKLELTDVISNWKDLSIDAIEFIFQRFTMNTKNYTRIIRDKQEELQNMI